MIASLYIQNYAIIDEVKVDFLPGLTAITGETGAGKSILLGALGLVLGERADSQVLYDRSKKCIVEVGFNLKDKTLAPLFEGEDLDFDAQCIIRREINSKGKSRAFINDTPTTLAVLKKICSHLVDLHQQFDTQEINQQSFQLQILDLIGNHQTPLVEYQSVFTAFRRNRIQLKKLQDQLDSWQKESDFVQFQYDELEKLALSEGELAESEQAIQRVQFSEEIKAAGYKTFTTVEDGNNSILDQLNEVARDLEKVGAYDGSASEIAQRIYGTIEELKDISAFAKDMADRTEYDPSLQEELSDRINEINSMLSKHRVTTDTQLLAIKEDLNLKLSQLGNSELELEELEATILDQSKQLSCLAASITSSRKMAAGIVEEKTQKILKELSMPNAQLSIQISPADEFNKYGKDDLQYMFSANLGIPLAPLHKVASGGELSRLNLALKSIVADRITLPSLIFDEIDTGVSGNVALRMGKLIKNLSRQHQTIIITHSPQIAALADQHLFIFKYDQAGRTHTNLRLLAEGEKTEEIAKMLSGDPPSEAALENAKALRSIE